MQPSSVSACYVDLRCHGAQRRTLSSDESCDAELNVGSQGSMRAETGFDAMFAPGHLPGALSGPGGELKAYAASFTGPKAPGVAAPRPDQAGVSDGLAPGQGSIGACGGGLRHPAAQQPYGSAFQAQYVPASASHGYGTSMPAQGGVDLGSMRSANRLSLTGMETLFQSAETLFGCVMMDSHTLGAMDTLARRSTDSEQQTDGAIMMESGASGELGLHLASGDLLADFGLGRQASLAMLLAEYGGHMGLDLQPGESMPLSDSSMMTSFHPAALPHIATGRQHGGRSSAPGTLVGSSTLGRHRAGSSISGGGVGSYMHHQQPQQPLSAPAHMAAAVGATGPFNGFGGDTAHLFSHLRSSEDGLAPVAGLGASFSAGGARPAPPPAQLPLQQPQQQAAAAEPAMPGLARLQLPVIGRGGDVSSCSGDEDSSWAEPAGRAGFASMAVDSRAATPATPGTPGTPMLGKNGIALPSGVVKGRKGGNKRRASYIAKNTGRRNVCRNCGTHQTPQWRCGPEGPRTLCNACGVRYKKVLSEQEAEMAATAAAAAASAPAHLQVPVLETCQPAGSLHAPLDTDFALGVLDM